MDILFITQHPFLGATCFLYVLAFLFYALAWRSLREWVGRLGSKFMLAAVLGNAAVIVTRWIIMQNPPFQSLFESMVLLAFCVGTVYLIIERLFKTRFLGVFCALGSCAAIAFAIWKWNADVIRLPPALQSAWFIPHVVVYFFGYGALFFAWAASCMQLMKPSLVLRAGTMLKGSIDFEDLAYKTIRFGFVLLTFGLLVGAIWAKQAWGDFWVWDPKENWSLVSWLAYATYLHLRHSPSWRGKRAAWLAIGAFALVMFTYLGMNLLPSAGDSAHVYQ